MDSPFEHSEYQTLPFGEAVSKRRDQLGLTQGDLGARLNQSQSAISKLEKLQTPPLDGLYLSDLADILEMPLEDLRNGRIRRLQGPSHNETAPELIRRLVRLYAGKTASPQPQQLERLLENYLELLREDPESAQKLVDEGDWLKNINRRGRTKAREDEQPYDVEA